MQSYDDEVVTTGAMRKTLYIYATTELEAPIWQFKKRYPEKYEDTFACNDWAVIKKSTVKNDKINHPRFVRYDFPLVLQYFLK